ncbi:MAG: hypothetical protein AAF995_00460 [Planctomycetota bacterium]
MSPKPPNQPGSQRPPRKQMRRAQPEPASAKATAGRPNARNGLLLAGAAAVLFASILGWAVLRNPPPSNATASDGPAPGDIPDITDLQVAEGMRLEFTDRDDPNRLAGLVTADRVEPVGPSERVVEQPRAFLFLDDGRTLHVRADRGRFFVSTPEEPPESGTLRGDVVISVFDPLEGGRQPDPATDVPFGTATFDEPLSFDFTHARASTTGRFVIDTPGIEFIGEHLTVVLNEVRGRLELAEVRRGESIRFKASAEAADDPAPVATETPSDTGRAPRTARGEARRSTAPTGPIVEPVEVLYQAAFLEDVRVAQGPRSLASDTLDLWIRLIDNQLPEGAIREIAAATGAAEEQPETQTEAQPERPADPVPVANVRTADDAVTTEAVREALATAPAASATRDAEQQTAEHAGAGSDPDPDPGDIMLTWTGRLRIVPIDVEANGAPDQLVDDHVALRFTAATTGLVAFTDEDRGASARAVSMSYGATTARLALAGPGGAVELAQPGAGSLSASTVEGSLADGSIDVRGPGALLGDDAPTPNAEPLTRVRWTESARFAFHTEPDGRITPVLRSADFAGDVDATDGTASVDARALSTAFARTLAGPGGETPMLERIAIERGIVRDGRGGNFSADNLSVAFEPGTLGEDFDPASLTARGSVLAADDRRTLIADELDAGLTRRLDGQISITGAHARGGVAYTDEGDEIRAAGDLLRADAIGELVRLEGTPASIAQGRATITGPIVLLDGRRRAADVEGAGTFVQHDEAGVPVVRAAWSEDMRFDDLTGRIDCRGDASAESASGPRSTELLEADRLVIEITPFGEPSGGPSGAQGERELLRATASGARPAPGDTTDERLASIESRTVSADDPSFVERLVSLRGRRIIADNLDQTLTVPGTGTLLSLDRTASANDPVDDNNTNGADGADALAMGSPGPGLTSFRWDERMILRRSQGTADLLGNVEVRHKALGANDISVLRSDRLLARFEETGGNTQAGVGPANENVSGGALRAELVSVDATGAVRFRNAGREVVADRLFYDALNALANASAYPGRFVELLDENSGVPVTAEALRWDLVRDRIEIDRPGPTSVGRP